MLQREINPKTDRLLYTVTNPNGFQTSVGNRIFEPRQTHDVFVTVREAAQLQRAGWSVMAVEDVSVNADFGLPTRDQVIDASGSMSGSSLGTIRYGTTVNSLSTTFDAGVRKQLRFVADPAQTSDYLNPPFVGMNFWQNNKITPRRKGDFYFILVNLLVQASVADGRLLVDLDVGSPQGPIGTDTEDIFGNAAVTQRVTFKLYLLTGDLSLANGATVNMTSDVPVTVLNAAITVNPLSIYLGKV